MGNYIGQLAEQMGSNAVGGIMGLMLGGINDDRQIRQQQKLQNMQITGNKEMMDYGMMKQLEMWKNTSYGAQVEQMQKAGINPALLYGMGGGGGQSTGSPNGNVTGGNAPTGGREVQDIMGIQMQRELLKAQKENIEADTANKRAGAEGQGLENALTAWLQGTTPEGEDVGADMGKSVRGQTEIGEIHKTRADTKFKLDENDRQKLMNDAVMKEIGAKISLMHKQGQTQEEIYRNLVKEGALLDAEIAWNALDISEMSVGKFITNIIKMLFRPR